MKRFILLFFVLSWSSFGWSAYYQTLNCSSNLNLKVKSKDNQIVKVKSDFRRNLQDTSEVEVYTKQNIKVGVLHPQSGMNTKLEKNMVSQAKLQTNNTNFVDLNLKLAGSQYYFHCFLDM